MEKTSFPRMVGLIALTVSLMLSCASTSVSTIRNPDVPSLRFETVMVSAPFQDLELRTFAESQFVQHLSEYGVDAVRAIDIIPPVRTYSEEEIQSALASNHIDAVLIATLTNAYSDQSYIPESSTTSGSATVYGDTVYSESTTSTSGGYYVSKPRVRFDVKLFVAKSGDVAWRATTFTQGNAFANSQTLLESLSMETTRAYVKDAGLNP